MSRASTNIMLGLGLAGLIVETIVSHPALAVDKVKLFKVTTPQAEIVIGLTKDELAQFPGKDAAGLTKVLADNGAIKAWQYAERHGANGQPEQAAVKRLIVTAGPDVHIEPFKPQMKVVPITEERMAQAVE